MNNIHNKKRWILIAMTGSLSMLMIDQTVISVILPHLRTVFNSSVNSEQWIVNSYILTFAVFLAIGGRLGDIFGCVKTFKFGLILFAFASLCCGISVSAEMLIVSRIFQGLGAAFMQPASDAIVSNTFDISERGKAIALYAGISMAFMAVGPLLGGYFTEFISWRWAFFINVPVAVMSLFILKFNFPKYNIQVQQKIDFKGMVLSIISVTLIVFSIQQSSVWGILNFKLILLLILGIVLFAVFILIEKKQKHPLLQFSYLKNINFLDDSIVFFSVSFFVIPAIIFNSIYLQKVINCTPIATGVYIAIPVVISIITAQFAGRMFDKYKSKTIIWCGLLCLGINSLIYYRTLNLQNIDIFVIGLIFLGLGMGLIMTPVNTDAQNQLSEKERGEASGILQTVRQLGSALGLAVLGTVYAYSKQNLMNGSQLQSITAKSISDLYLAGLIIILIALIISLILNKRKKNS